MPAAHAGLVRTAAQRRQTTLSQERDRRIAQFTIPTIE
jgi:hypothetical protein